MRSKLLAGLVALVALCAGTARANIIALDGSDATTTHQNADYTNQLFSLLQNGSAAPILVLGTVGLNTTVNCIACGIPANYVLDPNGYSLTNINLSNYSGIYVESPDEINQADTSISAADQLAIANSGLNIGIELYGGGPNWGPMLPLALNTLPVADFQGDTNYNTGPANQNPLLFSDGEILTNAGQLAGFTQPPAMQAFEHVAYLTSAFTGFTSYIDSDPNSGLGPGYSTLLVGSFNSGPNSGGTVPEPTSVITMVGAGLLGLVGLRRRKTNV